MLNNMQLIIVEQMIKEIDMRYIYGDIRKTAILKLYIVVIDVLNWQINIVMKIRYIHLKIIQLYQQYQMIIDMIHWDTV